MASELPTTHYDTFMQGYSSALDDALAALPKERTLSPSHTQDDVFRRNEEVMFNAALDQARANIEKLKVVPALSGSLAERSHQLGGEQQPPTEETE